MARFAHGWPCIWQARAFGVAVCAARFGLKVAMCWMAVNAMALECPKLPQQTGQSWETEVQTEVSRMGRATGPAVTEHTRRATTDLLSHLPGADKVYLEQMMFASYCSAVRDNPDLTEQAREARIKTYAALLRQALNPSSQKAGKPDPHDEALRKLARIPVPYTAEEFFDAIREGKTEVVALFLKAGMNPNSIEHDDDDPDADSAGYLALTVAAGWGQEDIVRLLLNAGANPGVDGWKALRGAARLGSLPTIQMLLERSPGPEAIEPAFIEAAASARPEAAALLSKRLPTSRMKLAASRALLALAQYNASPEGPEGEARVLPLTRQLIDLGANVNGTEAPGQVANGTPLTMAVRLGHVDMVKALLAAHAEVDRPCTCDMDSNGGGTATALQLAASTWDAHMAEEFARMLVAGGASLTVLDDARRTLLMRALYSGQPSVASYFLERGADVNARDETGHTALMYAAERYDDTSMASILQDLLNHGAQVNAQDKDGNSALHAAAWGECISCAEILVSAHADVNLRSRAGRTPLITAIHRGSVDVTRFLLTHGAQAQAEDEDGKTTIAYAKEVKDSENRSVLLSLLKKWGAHE